MEFMELFTYIIVGLFVLRCVIEILPALPAAALFLIVAYFAG